MGRREKSKGKYNRIMIWEDVQGRKLDVFYFDQRKKIVQENSYKLGKDGQLVCNQVDYTHPKNAVQVATQQFFEDQSPIEEVQSPIEEDSIPFTNSSDIMFNYIFESANSGDGIEFEGNFYNSFYLC